MIKTIEKRICDICKREVQEFAGTLSFRYSTGNVAAKIVRDDICIDCCIKLEKRIREALEDVSNDNEEK